jgi:hypothetical protein
LDEPTTGPGGGAALCATPRNAPPRTASVKERDTNRDRTRHLL